MLYYATFYTPALSPQFHLVGRPFSGCLSCPLRPRCATRITMKNPRVFSPGVLLILMEFFVTYSSHPSDPNTSHSPRPITSQYKAGAVIAGFNVNSICDLVNCILYPLKIKLPCLLIYSYLYLLSSNFSFFWLNLFISFKSKCSGGE